MQMGGFVVGSGGICTSCMLLGVHLTCDLQMTAAVTAHVETDRDRGALFPVHG
jgi:hypothetical protein